MPAIQTVRLRRVLDSRGDPTVEADVLTESGGFGRAAAPSGASTGAHEAVERPAGEAIAAAREHAVPRLRGANAADQREIDAAIRAADGTADLSEIGANSAVALSMAAAKAGADVLGVPLFQHLGGAFRGEAFPVPLGNVIGGGEHAADATHVQEFLAAPVEAPNVREAVFANARVHERVARVLDRRDRPAGKGDEGAWAPAIDDAEAFEVLAAAVADVEEAVGFGLRMGVDVAAAELYDSEAGVYRYGDATRTPAEQVEYVAGLIEEHDLVYVEDPVDEEDFEGMAELTDRVGAGRPGDPGRTLLCGDDLFVTDVDRIGRGVAAGAGNAVLVKPNQIGTLSGAVDAIELAREGAGNAVLVKPNQIGTLSGAVDAIELAREQGYAPVVSHRSGETEDATIAHLAVGTAAPYIKTGAVGGERTAKLNELIRIAEDAV